MWPWGGIRAYLKYIYHHFPRDQFEIILLANPTKEREHLERSMKSENIPIVWAKPFLGRNFLFFWTARMLRKGNFDIIHSHGYISAFNVSLVSWLFRVPHVFTIHGILVEKYFKSRFGAIKRLVFRNSLRSVAAFHGIGEDILEYSRALFPELTRTGARWVAIPSGITVEPFIRDQGNEGELLRSRVQCSKDTFIFGFLGRFQPEKGFNYIIDAAEILIQQKGDGRGFIVVAAGSGEYKNDYKKEIEKRGLTGLIRFLPFESAVESIIKGCDAILMPSVSEAMGLVACETLCSGVPLIATDCPGLRETIEGTPAVRISPHNAEALAGAMRFCMTNPELKEKFTAFRGEAGRRFDAKTSAERLISLFREVVSPSAGTV